MLKHVPGLSVLWSLTKLVRLQHCTPCYAIKKVQYSWDVDARIKRALKVSHCWFSDIIVATHPAVLVNYTNWPDLKVST